MSYGGLDQENDATPHYARNLASIACFMRLYCAKNSEKRSILSDKWQLSQAKKSYPRKTNFYEKKPC